MTNAFSKKDYNTATKKWMIASSRMVQADNGEILMPIREEVDLKWEALLEVAHHQIQQGEELLKMVRDIHKNLGTNNLRKKK